MNGAINGIAGANGKDGVTATVRTEDGWWLCINY
jgi:hypothetical protein